MDISVSALQNPIRLTRLASKILNTPGRGAGKDELQTYLNDVERELDRLK